VLSLAFALNQAVGRGLLTVQRPEPLEWPEALAPPAVRTSLLVFPSARVEAFSFTLVEPMRAGRVSPHRHEIILLSRGLVLRLDARERVAVVAHELGHVGSLDGRYLTFLRTLARMMRWDPVLAYLAWTLTRREEFRADEVAARLTRNPRALARALYKALTDADAGGPWRTGLTAGFLGSRNGRRRRREVLARIRRLVELADSPEFRSADGRS
jgi:Zn-dependent protease with chaperone function